MSNRLGANYKFTHYRSLDPNDLGSPRELVWASTVGEFNGVREGSRDELEILREQDWMHNFLTDAGEDAMLDTFFRNNHTPTFYFALYNATPAETSTMSITTEVTGTGYARISVARNTTDWGALATNGAARQTTSLTKTFTATAGGGGFSSANQLLLVSSASGTSGTLYAAVALSTTRTLAAGDSLNASMAVSLS